MIASHITIQPENRESIIKAFNAGLISEQTRTEKLHDLTCVCGEACFDEWEIREHREKCDEAFIEDHPDTCVLCKNNERRIGGDICVTCDRKK